MKWADLLTKIDSTILTAEQCSYLTGLFASKDFEDEVDFPTYMSVVKKLNQRQIPFNKTQNEAPAESSKTKTTLTTLCDTTHQPSASTSRQHITNYNFEKSLPTEQEAACTKAQNTLEILASLPQVDAFITKEREPLALPQKYDNKIPKTPQNPFTLDIDELMSSPNEPCDTASYVKDVKDISTFIHDTDDEKESFRVVNINDYIHHTFLKTELKELKSAQVKLNKILNDLNPVVVRLQKKLMEISDECTSTCKFHLQKSLTLKTRKKKMVQVKRLSK